MALACVAPAAHMRQQPARQRDRRLPLLGLPKVLRRQEMPAIEIDEAPAGHPREGGLRDRAGAAAGVEPDQDEAGDVAARAPVSAAKVLLLAIAPGGAQECRRFLAGQPALAG